MKSNIITSLTKERKKIIPSVLKYLENHKLNSLNGNKSKLYTGKLSPGCKTCIEGTWACIFINKLCTRKCFFCPQNKPTNYDIIPTLDGVRLFSVDDCVDFLKKFKFKGVGFSGGEPLLAFDRLVKFISTTRKAFGRNMYIWMYTNGDLATKERLNKLKKAGLDEIRFDLAARNYDLKPVKLAKKYIKNVTIETPVIPEDYNILIKSLEEIQKLKVNYINLHELVADKFNINAFKKRDYVLKSRFSPNKDVELIPVLNSELSSLKMMKYLIENKLKVNANYCTRIYKHRYQTPAKNKRYSPYILGANESISPIGLIRRIEIEDISKDLMAYLKSNRNKHLWKKEGKIINVSIESLEKIIPYFKGTNKLYINYYAAEIANAHSHTKTKGKIIKLNSNFSINITKSIMNKVEISDQNSLLMYNLLFIKKHSFNASVKKIISMNRKDMNVNTYYKIVSSVLRFYNNFNDLEFISSDLA